MLLGLEVLALMWLGLQLEALELDLAELVDL